MTKVNVLNHQGKVAGTVNLPTVLFGQTVDETLLAQASRVYTHHSRQTRGYVKTRGQVKGSTKKIYRQKGTGGARHGAKSAPIFVGGGKAHGPRGVIKSLRLNKSTRKQALAHALSLKVKNHQFIIFTDLTSIKPAKTKNIHSWLVATGQPENVSRLWLVSSKEASLRQGGQNIPRLDFLPVNLVNSDELLHHQLICISIDSVNALLELHGQKLVKLTTVTTKNATKKPTTQKKAK